MASAASGARDRGAAGRLPKACPPAALVRSTLKLKVTTVTSNTTVPEYPYGSTALPKAKPPRLVVDCVYAASGAFTRRSNIVPVTISFAELVSKDDFAMSRRNAALSSHPVRLKGIGDVAWLVKPPTYDPRAGSSLFVLTGTTDIVISAPPTASTGALESLARKLATIARNVT